MQRSEEEKADLLNRAASKDWQTYIQMAAAPATTSGSVLDSGPLPVGMLDSVEMERAGIPAYDPKDLEDLANLGILPGTGS